MAMADLKIDIDGRMSIKTFLAKVNRMMYICNFVDGAYVTFYKTMRGYHIYINLFYVKLKPSEIIALQLYLGSDRERELFNLERTMRHIEGWNVLFCRKKKNNKEVSSEKFIEAVYVGVRNEDIKKK
jgi:hypothetical protein